MKSISTDVYELIETLSKSEKRYISSYLSTGEKNNLKLKFFNVISKKSITDYATFEKKLTWIKNTFKVKYDLYNSILKILEDYNYNNDEVLKLRRSLNQITILYDKKLYPQCQKLIHKSLKKAQELEDFKLIYEFQLFNRKLLVLPQNKKFNEAKQMFPVLHNTLNKIGIEISFLEAQTTMLSFDNKKEIDFKKLDEIIHQSFFTEKNSLISNFTRLKYLGTLSSYYSLKKDKEQRFQYSKKIVAFYLEKKHLKKLPKTTFFNHMNACSSSAKYSDFESISKMYLENYSASLEFIRVRLVGLIILGKMEEALSLNEHIEEIILQEDIYHPSHNLYSLLFNFSAINFFTKNYKSALYYNNLVLNSKNFESQNYLKRISKITHLLIHYFYGNYKIVDSLFLNYKRNIKNNKELDPLEDWFLIFYANLLEGKKKSDFYRNEEKNLLLKVSKENMMLTDVSGLLIWLRIQHDNISLNDATIDQSNLDSEVYKKKRLKIL